MNANETSERDRLLSEYSDRFKETWNFRPKMIGSWSVEKLRHELAMMETLSDNEMNPTSGAGWSYDGRRISNSEKSS